MQTDSQYLRPLKRAAKPHPLAAFDVEGIGGAGGFVCGAVVSDLGRYQFSDPAELLAYLTSPELRGYWLFAHNAEYDLCVLTGGDLRAFSCLFVGTRFLWAETQDLHGHKWKIVDSGNIFAGDSIRDLGRMVDLPKLDLHPRLEQALRSGTQLSELPPADAAQVQAYNLRDADILYLALETLQEELLSLGGELHPTAAGISMDLFRRAYLKIPWPTPHPALNDLARSAYYGARTEPYRLGRVPGVNGYDVSSLYPAVQRDAQFPDPAFLVVESETDGRAQRLEREGVSYCSVSVADCEVPPLPVHCKEHLFFPTGKMTGAWTHLELRHALDHGATIEKIHWSLWSTRTFNPFTTFIDDLYRRKVMHAASGDLRARVFKLLLNSSHGRFGINPDTSLNVLQPIAPPVDWDRLPPGELKMIGDYPYLLAETGSGAQPVYTNVLIAATVTAAARVKMHGYLERYREILAYTDTDSLWCAGEVEMGEGLGEFRQTQKERDLWVVAPKEYAVFSGEALREAHVKGIPDAEAAYYLAFGKAAFRSPLSMHEAFRQGWGAATWVQRLRERRGAWPKRPPDEAIGFQDGWWPTRPWAFQEIDSLVRSGRPAPAAWPQDPGQAARLRSEWAALCRAVEIERAAKGHS
jgi:hypothetical protein